MSAAWQPMAWTGTLRQVGVHVDLPHPEAHTVRLLHGAYEAEFEIHTSPRNSRPLVTVPPFPPVLAEPLLVVRALTPTARSLLTATAWSFATEDGHCRINFGTHVVTRSGAARAKRATGMLTVLRLMLNRSANLRQRVIDVMWSR